MSPIHIDVNTNFLEAVGRLFLTIGDFSNEQKIGRNRNETMRSTI